MYRKFLKKMVRLVTYSAIVVMLVISCVYMVSMVRVSSENLSATNDACCRQTASALEMLINQSKHQAYRFVLDDNGICDLIKEMRVTRSSARKLLALLTKTLQNDPYYESVYLYSEEDGWIMTSTLASNTRIFDEADFEDQQIIAALKTRKGAMLEPRIVCRSDISIDDRPPAKELILPITIPVRESDFAPTSCMLVINVNIGDVFTQLLDPVSAGQGVAVYITDKQGKILVAQDFDILGMQLSEMGYAQYPDDLIASMISGDKMRYQAEYASEKLGWTLHVIRLEDSRSMLGIHIGGLLIAVVLLGGTVIIITKMALRRITRPVSELDNKSYEHSIKEQMLSPGILPDRSFSFRHERYFVVTIQFPETAAERFEAMFFTEIVWPENVERHLIPIQVGHTALVVSFDGDGNERFWRDWLSHTHRRMESLLDEKLFFTVSAPRKSTRALSEAYQETLLMINYTMRMDNARVLHSGDVTPGVESVAYPEVLEKQLINNLLIGDAQTCYAIIDEFIAMLFDKQTQMNNQEILAWLERLENHVLLAATAVPLRLPEDINDTFSIWDTRKSIREKLVRFAQAIIGRVNKRTVEKHEGLEQRIREYIGQNFTDPNFSFTSICDHFSIGRSQLTSIFREKMGGSFSEYVNDLKIEKAKALLGDKKMTIDAVAHEAGFSYAHYFIKVFKAKEGVTPGQYREHIGGTDKTPPPAQTDDNNAFV